MTGFIGIGKGSPSADGYVFKAPIGTALPTTATEALASAFVPVGLISSDGVRWGRTEETNEERDWAGRVISTWSSRRTETAACDYVETSPNVMKEYYGNATGTEGSFYTDHDGDREPGVYVFDSIIGTDGIKRSVCPNGMVTSTDEIQEYEGGLLKYPCHYTFSYDRTAGYTVRDYYATAESAASGTDGH